MVCCHRRRRPTRRAWAAALRPRPMTATWAVSWQSGSTSTPSKQAFANFSQQGFYIEIIGCVTRCEVAGGLQECCIMHAAERCTSTVPLAYDAAMYWQQTRFQAPYSCFSVCVNRALMRSSGGAAPHRRAHPSKSYPMAEVKIPAFVACFTVQCWDG